MHTDGHTDFPDHIYTSHVVDSRFDDHQIVASIVLIHGFNENHSISMTEMAIMYSLNGFEVYMLDTSGFGLTSG
jgi:alpha-beta hydrolase superfamily lysophospholipase